MSDAKKSELGLKGKDWVGNPLLKIKFTVGRKGRNLDRGRGGRGGGDYRRGGGESRGGRGGGDDMNGGGQPRGGGYGGRGCANTRGHIRGCAQYFSAQWAPLLPPIHLPKPSHFSLSFECGTRYDTQMCCILRRLVLISWTRGERCVCLDRGQALLVICSG